LRPDNQLPKGAAGYQYSKEHGTRAQEQAGAATTRDARLQQEDQEELQNSLEQELEEVGVNPFLSCLSPSELTRGC
jgi:hypothetical protein